MVDIKNKKTGPLPRQVKRIIKHAQSEKVNINVDFGELLSDPVNIEQIVEAINKPHEQTTTHDKASLRATYVANQLTAERQDKKKGTFDLEAIYTERATKLAHEMVKGFREGWSENSLNKREVCLNCLQFFWKQHDNQEFCSDKCRAAFDRERSKREMEERREEEERRKWGEKIVREEEERFKAFETFLRLAGGNVDSQMEVGPLIKKSIPGGWKTVNQWLSQKDTLKLWDSLCRELQDIIVG